MNLFKLPGILCLTPPISTNMKFGGQPKKILKIRNDWQSLQILNRESLWIEMWVMEQPGIIP